MKWDQNIFLLSRYGRDRLNFMIHTVKESGNDHRVISVLLNHRMTSHRSVSGPLNSLQMATTGN